MSIGITAQARYKPVFTAPGIPGIDYAVGRTSSNNLKKAIISTSTNITGISTSSVSIGTGSKVFTIDLSKSSTEANSTIELTSAGSPSNKMSGTVTSLVGTTLTVNVTTATGSGTFSDWKLSAHYPPNSFELTQQLRHGSTVAPWTVADWDFRGMFAIHWIQNTMKVTFSQCLFDMRAFNYSNYTGVGPFIGVRSGTATFEMDHCTVEGAWTTAPLTCHGTGLVSCTYCHYSGLPADWLAGGLGGPAVDREIAYTVVHVVDSADVTSGYHADCMQFFQGMGTSTSLHIHHCVFAIEPTPPNGIGITAPMNWSLENIGSPNWSTPTTMDNVILTGGSYNIYCIHGAGTTVSADIDLGANIYLGGGIFGLVYTQGYFISNATKANPCVITTSTSNGFSNGSAVYINNVTGMTQLNGNTRYIVANKSGNTFELQGIDSTGYSNYISGGGVNFGNLEGMTVAGLKNVNTGATQSFSFNNQTVTSYS